MNACEATAPAPVLMCGTSAPTAKNLVATAMPVRPACSSRAMIDQVIGGIPLLAQMSGPLRRRAARLPAATEQRRFLQGRQCPNWRNLPAGQARLRKPLLSMPRSNRTAVSLLRDAGVIRRREPLAAQMAGSIAG